MDLPGNVDWTATALGSCDNSFAVRHQVPYRRREGWMVQRLLGRGQLIEANLHSQ